MSVSIDLNKLRVTTTSLSAANLFTGYLCCANIPRLLSGRYFEAPIRNEMGIRCGSGDNARYFIITINMDFNVLPMNPMRPILSVGKIYGLPRELWIHVLYYLCGTHVLYCM